MLIFLVVFSTFSFRDLLFEFLSLTVKVRFLEWYLMLESRKLSDDSPVRCSWIHGTSQMSWSDRLDSRLYNFRLANNNFTLTTCHGLQILTARSIYPLQRFPKKFRLNPLQSQLFETKLFGLKSSILSRFHRHAVTW
jgi:hypothetical protein